MYDKDKMQKEVADLKMQLKQLFFEGRTVRKALTEAEKTRKSAQITLENELTTRNLVQIAGEIKPKATTAPRLRQSVKASDIQDYSSLNIRENPLAPVTRKFEEKGWTAE